MQQSTVVIIGTGLVGLATGWQLLRKQPGLKLLILDKEDGPARHQSGHNSGVIHSGIYYKPGSLKAQNCIRGYRYLIEFCQMHGVPHRICGKMIVATDEAAQRRLPSLLKRAQENGLLGVRMLDAGEMREKEPFIEAKGAIWVPQTGVIDFKAMAARLASEIRNLGGELIFGAEVCAISHSGNKLAIFTGKGDFSADMAINCAGLHSDVIARMAGVRLKHRIIPFRGEYWMLSDEAAEKVNGLVYPVPDPELPFLGVHLTRMLDRKVEAGPNAVLAWKREGYQKGDFSMKDALSIATYPGVWRMGMKHARTGAGEMFRSMSKAAFTRAVQRLMPSVSEQDLLPGHAGVRAQALLRNGQLADDFIIEHSANMLHVCNAPSPAATSSLSIGDYLSGGVLARMGLKHNN